MNHSVPKIFRKLSGLRTWALLLVSFLVVGCGGGSDNGGTGDFVFTGDNSQPVAAAPGSMTFNFVTAQTALTVPASTTDIRFRFYSEVDGNGTLVQQETRDFASTITIDPVDARTRSVVVTALDADGFPVFQSTVNVATVSNENVVVDFTGATSAAVSIDQLVVTPPIANLAPGGTQQFTASLLFTNGEQLPANNVVWSATGQASVDVNTGLVTATTDGNASVTATRGDLMTTANITVGDGPVLDTLTVTPDGIDVGTGSEVLFEVTGTDQNGDPFPLTDVVWSIEAGTAAIEATTGRVTFTTENMVTVRATVGAIFDDATVNVLDSVPTVTFADTTTLMFLSTETPTLAMTGEVTVTDNQPNLSGGTLRFRPGTPGTVFDVTFDVPATTIGTVSNNNTANVSVLLNNTATPAEIASLIETTTISYTNDFGNGTFVVELSDGQGNSAFPASRPFSIPNPTPVVTLDAGQLVFDVRETPVVSTAATVTDDVDPMTMGSLNFSLTGTVTDAQFTAPMSAGVGSITNNGTSNVTVNLTNATLVQIQDVINATTLAFGGSRGTGTIQVTLTDQDGNTSAAATRLFQLNALNLVVSDIDGMGVPQNQFSSIQAAVNEVAASTGASGSTITVDANYVPSAEQVFITANDADLDGLNLLGNAAGQSAGVVPAGTRSGTLVASIDVINQFFVTVDGFDFNGADPGMVLDTAIGVTVENCLFNITGDGISVVTTDSLTVRNCGFNTTGTGVVHGSGSPGATYNGNAFTGNNLGLSLLIPDGTEVIAANGFVNNTIHLSVTDGSLVTASGNDFGNNGGTVVSNGSATINAQGNWWGQASGPLVSPPDAYTQAVVFGTGSIDTTNFLVTDPFPGFGT